MDILIAIPVYHREEMSLNCIMSLLDTTMVPKETNVTVVVGINVASDEFKSIMSDLAKKQVYKGIRLEVVDFGKNIGKPSVVNRITEGRKFDYLVSLDGDMICIQPYWLKGMISIYEEYNRSPSITGTIKNKSFRVPLGALCGYQFGNSCHAVDLKQPYVKQRPVGAYNIVTTLGNGGIAGGILMTDYDSWKTIGGYETSTIYGGDDGYYCGQCHNIRKLVAYVKEIGFYHPYEINKQYQDWKVRALQMINKDGPGLSKDEMKGFFK